MADCSQEGRPEGRGSDCTPKCGYEEWADRLRLLQVTLIPGECLWITETDSPGFPLNCEEAYWEKKGIIKLLVKSTF